ncbi:hypothetical protein [Nocardia sp. bgisy134]|uniref:hypothetical protein n=1 Tax=Nocardia sp. bgisy134 TaxID=3413789 RepID=UPI003D74EDC2
MIEDRLAMTPFDNDMLEFACAWAPFGGNDEEAFIRFGLRPKEFHAAAVSSIPSRTGDQRTDAELTAAAVP